MTGDRSDSIAQFDGKAVPQFAPNFTVYVLPSNVVCFYSENRKFFLHGEIICALASAIAKGTKSFGQLVRELEKTYPRQQVLESLKRLVDRRYIVPKSQTSTGTAPAFWASIGMPTEVAEKNLQSCKVRIQSIDVQGAKELGAALKALGVRVVTSSPDLTVTLVNDYLDDNLAEPNREHLSDGSSWLLVQPSGIFPLVGPVLNPGKGPCWVCLADQMKRNREIRAFLYRTKGRPISVSPLVRQSVGQASVQFAAVEIAKAIATGFRTDLTNHIVSFDLPGSSIAKHYVAHRPQCPACGKKEFYSPTRKPVPVEPGASGKLVMTSGGYRTVASRETVARYRKYVSPLTGIVSRLERIEANLPMNTSFYAAHNFSAPAETVDELRAGLSGGSFGKGSNSEQGEASALMEAIERYSGLYQGNEIRVKRRFTDFPEGDAILPNDVLLFSDAQHRPQNAPPPHGGGHHATPRQFDPSARIDWTPIWSLRDKRFKYLPTSLLYFFYPGDDVYHADSNGCAAGNTLEEAVVQGFLELVERDAYAIWWYNRLPRPQVDLARYSDSYIRDLQAQFTDVGRRLWVLDVTSDLEVPTFVAITHWIDEGKENIEFGAGAHFDPRIALLRTLTELNQFLAIGHMGNVKPDKSSLDGKTPFKLADHPYLAPQSDLEVPADLGVKFRDLDTRGQVNACVDLARQAGLDFLVLDQTRPDIEAPVVRVVVPGLRHFYRRFAPGRLYDVPVKLGLRDRTIMESELNPYHPQT